MSNRFGQNLKQLRIDRGLSQEQLAVTLGTTKQVISRYENELRSPKIDVVVQYAEKLHISLAQLTGYDITPSQARSILIAQQDKQDTLSKKAKRVGQLYDLADAQTQKIVDVTLEPYSGKVKK